ncbi:MAG: IPT/TIG domain-containing protein, partial [bacterium]
SPQDGQTGVAVNTTLSWSGGDPDGDAVTYDVYFGTSSPPPLVKSNHTSFSYNPGTLTQSTTYHWQVVAKDNQVETAQGPEWSFTTGSCPLPSIRRLRPSSGSKGTLVIIYGRNFGGTQGSSSVTFYPDKTASIRKWRDTYIWCRVPAGAQSGPVTVTTSCGHSSGRQFTMAPPVARKLGPQVGGVGQPVTLWGNQFGRTRGTSKVTFNTTQVTQYESWSNNRVVVRVPAGATSGPVTVNTGV